MTRKKQVRRLRGGRLGGSDHGGKRERCFGEEFELSRALHCAWSSTSCFETLQCDWAAYPCVVPRPGETPCPACQRFILPDIRLSVLVRL